jgi:hypothetical protein
MEHQRHFDTSKAEQREAVKIRKMIGNLARSVQLLNCDIASEEEADQNIGPFRRHLFDPGEDARNSPR